MSKQDKTLERLTSSGRCTCNVKEYWEELKQMAKNEADPKNAKRRAKFFKALGDESRQRMISLLAVKELCVCEVISALEMTQPTTSHHLGILEEANIVETRKDGKWVFYSLADKEKIKQILQLVE